MLPNLVLKLRVEFVTKCILDLVSYGYTLSLNTTHWPPKNAESNKVKPGVNPLYREVVTNYRG